MDDVGAVAILNSFMVRGEARLVACIHNTGNVQLSSPNPIRSVISAAAMISQKVRQLVDMANAQPQDIYVLGKWPTKILWTTYVGSGIGTGPSLINTPENNPVRVAYDLFGVLRTGRQSWDLTASWLAVRGPGNVWDVIAGRPQFVDKHASPATTYPNESEVTVKMFYAGRGQAPWRRTGSPAEASVARAYAIQCLPGYRDEPIGPLPAAFGRLTCGPFV